MKKAKLRQIAIMTAAMLLCFNIAISPAMMDVFAVKEEQPDPALARKAAEWIEEQRVLEVRHASTVESEVPVSGSDAGMSGTESETVVAVGDEDIVLSAADVHDSAHGDAAQPAALLNGSSGVSGGASSYTSFNLVELGRTTPVKDQGETNLCWAFAAIAAAESNILTNGYADADTLDLSEKHLAYYTYANASDELGGTEGDYITPADSAENYITVGGYQWFPAVRLASWFGFAPEEGDWVIYPYEVYKSGKYYRFFDGYDAFYFEYGVSSDNYDDVSDVSQQNQNFSAEDGWGLSTYHLDNFYQISLSDTNAVKDMIAANGACALSVYMAQNADSLGYFNSATGAYYQADISNYYTNHDVVIVGWDDSYSRSNFATTPPCDGAWLCQNSYGTSFGNDGYFWLSYADSAVNGYCEDEMMDTGNTHTCTGSCELTYADVFFYECEPVGTDQHIYQHDGGGSTYRRTYSTNTVNQAAVFTSAGDGDGYSDLEYLTEIGFYTAQNAVDYSIQIYRHVNLAAANPNPTNGTAALSSPMTGTAKYAGYHTVKLDDPILLEEGERFSVAVAFTSSTGKVSIPIDYDSSNDWITYETAADSRETYYNIGSGWTDMKSEYVSNAKDYALRIKAKTIEYYDPVPVRTLSLNKSSLAMKVGKTAQLSAVYTPADATSLLRWSVTDSNGNATDDVIVFGSGATVIVSPTASGTYTVTVSANRLSASCELTVTQTATSLSLTPETAVIDSGKTLQLTAQVLPAGNTDNLTVKWTSSDSAAVSVSSSGLLTASSDVSHQGKTVTITATAGSFTKTCTVTVRKPASGLTISKTSAVMHEGETLQLTASISPADNTDGLTMVWSSSDTKVCAVNASGLVVTKGIGSATVTVTAGTLTKSCTIEIVPSLSLTPLGGSARLITPYGLRFGMKITKDNAYNKYKDVIVCYGTLIIPNDILAGAELTVDTPTVLNVVASKVLSEDSSAITYTGVLTGIPKSAFEREIAGRGYIKYRDVNGIEKYLYSDTIVRSYSGVCLAEYNKYVGKTNLTASEAAIFKNVSAIIEDMSS